MMFVDHIKKYSKRYRAGWKVSDKEDGTLKKTC